MTRALWNIITGRARTYRQQGYRQGRLDGLNTAILRAHQAGHTNLANQLQEIRDQ